MKKLVFLLGATVLADSVDKILADEASKVERLKNVRETLVSKIEEVKQIETDTRVKIEAEIKKLQSEVVDNYLKSLQEQERLQLEITKADKAIERLTK
ncbi:MAG: hypothetical protein ACRCXT_21945 [Paraclostridium sp.]